MSDQVPLDTAFVRIRPDTDGFAEDAEAKLKAAIGDASVKVPVVPETKDADARLALLKARLDEFSTRVTSTRVDVNDKDAQAKILALDAQLSKLNEKVARPDVSAAGVDDALAKVAALDVALDRINDKSSGSGTNAAKAAGADASSAGGFSSPLLAAGLASVPALGTTAAVTGAGILGLAAGFLTAAAGAGAFGAVAVPVIKNATDEQTKLNTAQAAYAKAQQQLEDATTKSQRATALKAEATALQQEKAITDQMSGSQLTFLGLLTQTQGAYKAIQTELAPAILDDANQALRDAGPLISALGPISAAVSPAVHGLLSQFGDAENTAGFHRFLAFVQTEAPTAITDLGQTAGNFGVGFGHTLEALTPLTNLVLGNLDHLSARFASADLGTGSEFGRFISYAQANAPLVGRDLEDVATAIGHLLIAVSPLGPPLLNVIDGIARIADEAAPTVREIVDDINPALKGTADVLHDLAPELGPVAADVGALFLAFKGYEQVTKATEALKGFALVQAALGTSTIAGTTAVATGAAATGAAAEGETAAKGVGGLALLRSALGNPAIVAGGVLAAGDAYQGFQDTSSLKGAQKKIATANNTLVANPNDPGAYQSVINQLTPQTYIENNTSGKTRDAYSAEVDKASASLEKLTSNTSALQVATGLSATSLHTLATTAGVDLTKSLDQSGAALLYLSKQQGLTVTQTKELAQAYGDFHNEAGDVQQSVQGLSEYFQSLTGKTADVVTSQDAFTTALRTTHLAIDPVSLSLTSNTTSAINNRTALAGLVTQLEQHTDALKSSGAPNAEIIRDYDTQYNKILALAGGNKQATTELVKLLDQLGAPSKSAFASFASDVPTLTAVLGEIGAAAQGAFGSIAAGVGQIETLMAAGRSATSAAQTVSGANKAVSLDRNQGSTTIPRAGGGPVKAGTLYKVNETGIELFDPAMNGNIEPAGSFGTSKSGKHITINLGGVTITSKIDLAEFEQHVNALAVGLSG